MVDHIKIGDVSPRVHYVGDGSQTAFTFPFPIFAPADLDVFVDGTPVASGFAVTGAGETAGGSVVFDVAPADGAAITLVRELAIARTTDFQEGGAFRAETINDELDRQTAFVQQVADRTGRCVQLPVADPDTSLILPPQEARANRLLGFDADGALETLVAPGFWRGDWTTATAYARHDSVRDPVGASLYLCTVGHTSATFAADLAAGRWQLAVDVAAVQAARAAAEAAQTTAEAAQAAAAGSASGAAESQAAAAASQALAGEWAEKPEDEEVAGFPGAYSARHWAAKAEAALAPDVARASQAQAEAGSDNATYMTPLRTAQHVASRVGTGVGEIVALQSVGGAPGLPAVDGSQLTGLTIEGFRARAGGGSPQGVPAFADTLAQFPSEQWDLNGSYDTVLSRFTPQVAGTYLVIAHVRLSAVPAANGAFAISFKKNGAGYSGSGTSIDTSIANSADLQHVGLVQLNGTTDYVEWYVFGTVPFEVNPDGNNTNVMAIRISGN